MIFGSGIDLVDIDRVKRLIDNSEAFMERVFTAKERQYCQAKKNYAESFAARFAAKEAFMKALGTGCRKGIKFSDIEVINDELGKPELVLYNSAREFCENKQIVKINLSLSHSKDIATAIVILEKNILEKR